MEKRISRRKFVKLAGAALVVATLPGCSMAADKSVEEQTAQVPTTGKSGEIYVPYNERQGKESVVYFTRDLSATGVLKIYDRVSHDLSGKVAVKLHTGEPHGPNIIPRPWVKALLAERLPEANIIETNTYYNGGRYTTEEHRKTLAVNGWTEFAAVDITDESGTAMLPVPGGKWFQEMSVGRNLMSMRQLSYMKEMGMGNDRYQLVDIDNDDKIINAQVAVQGIKGTWAGERL